MSMHSGRRPKAVHRDIGPAKSAEGVLLALLSVALGSVSHGALMPRHFNLLAHDLWVGKLLSGLSFR